MTKPSHGIPAQLCPSCGYMMDTATHTADGSDDGDGPAPGDYGMCVSCGELLCFDDGMNYRVPTAGEINALPDEVRQFLAKMKIAQAHLRKAGVLKLTREKGNA